MANQYDTKRVERKCNYCGKVMLVTPSKDKTYKNLYCSSRCQNTMHSERLTGRLKVGKEVFKCENCDKKILLSKKGISYSNHHFCSKECRKKGMIRIGAYKGELNGNWSGGLIEVECATCGTIKFVNKYTFNRNKNFFCNNECFGKWCSLNRVGENHPVYGTHPKHLIGENNHNWNNGISSLIHSVRSSPEYYYWKKKVLEKGKFECVICKDNNILNVHHLYSFMKLLQDNNINLPSQARNCKGLYNINNGVVLCKEHHFQFHKKYGVHNFTSDDFYEFTSEKGNYNL